MTCVECKRCGAIGIAAHHPYCLKCGNRIELEFRFLTEQEQEAALFLGVLDEEQLHEDQPH